MANAPSQRTKSKRGMDQAMKYLEASATSMTIALEPYFLRFPEKEFAYSLLMNALNDMRDAMDGILSDV